MRIVSITHHDEDGLYTTYRVVLDIGVHWSDGNVRLDTATLENVLRILSGFPIVEKAK